MVVLFDDVRPGDLITASLMNRIFDEIESLDKRVTALETGAPTVDGSVAITRLTPSSSISIGELLRIEGRNFGFSRGAHRVFFDNLRATVFGPGSSDTLLIVQVPQVPGATEVGKLVEVRVQNVLSGESDSSNITVFPQSLVGTVNLDLIDVQPATLTAGQRALFKYRIESQATRTASFSIQPTISRSDWQNLLQVLDADGQVIPSGQIQVTPGPQNRKEFFIAISQIPARTPSGTQFSLNVTASAAGVTGSTGDIDFTIGTPVEPPDDTILLSVNFVNPPNSFDAATNTISLGEGQIARVGLDASFSVAGTYDVSLHLSEDTSNWSMFLVQPPQDVSGSNAGTYGIDGSQVEQPEFSLKPEAGASASGRVEIRIQRQGESRKRLLAFKLALIP